MVKCYPGTIETDYVRVLLKIVQQSNNDDVESMFDFVHANIHTDVCTLCGWVHIVPERNGANSRSNHHVIFHQCAIRPFQGIPPFISSTG